MEKLDLIDAQGNALRDYLALILLNKPEQSNALDRSLLTNLTEEITSASSDSHCRGILIAGKGKNFCAGAHLSWMQESAKMTAKQNLAEAKLLTKLYESIALAPQPTMAFVRGAAYGGGVGLAAACDIVVTDENSRFCLSEVKLGLIPAVIVPYVKRRLTYGAMRHYGLSAAVISGVEATRVGLAEVHTTSVSAAQKLTDEWNQLLQGGPNAQKALKELLFKQHAGSEQQGDYTAEAIASVRVGKEAQAGLTAFFAKQTPSWVATIKNPKQLSSIFE